MLDMCTYSHTIESLSSPNCLLLANLNNYNNLHIIIIIIITLFTFYNNITSTTFAYFQKIP
jgi:hypothetical protein